MIFFINTQNTHCQHTALPIYVCLLPGDTANTHCQHTALPTNHHSSKKHCLLSLHFYIFLSVYLLLGTTYPIIPSHQYTCSHYLSIHLEPHLLIHHLTNIVIVFLHVMSVYLLLGAYFKMKPELTKEYVMFAGSFGMTFGSFIIPMFTYWIGKPRQISHSKLTAPSQI